MSKNELNSKAKNKKVMKALLWILLISVSVFVLMIMISPESKALPVFLIGFFVLMVIIVLMALYINYAYNIYKQIKED